MARLRGAGYALILVLATGFAPLLVTNSPAHAGNTATRVDHVVIISIDGLRPDAISAASAPNLSALIRQGVYCAQARTVEPIATLPTHTSMLTGLTPARHGVRFNAYRRGHYQGETIYMVAKRAGLSTAMFFAKSKLYYLADPAYLDRIQGPPANADDFHPPTSAARLAATFVELWPRYLFALTFVHLREPDIAGHAKGWMTKGYLSAVADADRAVGVLVSTLKASGRWSNTAVIVTADHGGSGRSHRPVIPENWTIPWLVVAPTVPQGLRIERTLWIYDTAPTALALLGLKLSTGGEGRVIEEIMRTRQGASVDPMRSRPLVPVKPDVDGQSAP
ncbi:MAG: alkaline phosphatase family protein [Acidiferrobacterales bacterium]|nr:alkaline phosphatase family protein [Acidiferrobacterales bacterium]